MTDDGSIFDSPEEDSPDLQDEEIAGAVVTVRHFDFADKCLALVHLSCPTCGKKRTSMSHAIRRRKPNLFARMTLQCEEAHPLSLSVHTFQVNWMGV